MCCSKTTFIFLDFLTETLSAVLLYQDCLFLQRDDIINIPKLVHDLKAYSVARLVVVPSLLKSIIGEISKTSNYLLNLRYVISSGDLLPKNLITAFFHCFVSTKLCNFYGSTEVTGDVLYKVFHSEEDLEETKGDNTTVGFPVANTNVYIVNDEGSLISNKTTIGELWISGSNISLGYTQGLTKNFVVNTFNKSAAHRTIFKTGDYGYLSNTGIILVGRKDRLVKIRGQKVNLNDIEASIQETDPTIEAHVLCIFF